MGFSFLTGKKKSPRPTNFLSNGSNGSNKIKKVIIEAINEEYDD